MAMVTVAEDGPLPLLPAPVMVKFFAAVIAVGVPVIAPVVVLKLNPAGKVLAAGEIDQLDTTPPVLLGLSELIATPTG